MRHPAATTVGAVEALIEVVLAVGPLAGTVVIAAALVIDDLAVSTEAVAASEVTVEVLAAVIVEGSAIDEVVTVADTVTGMEAAVVVSTGEAEVEDMEDVTQEVAASVGEGVDLVEGVGTEMVVDKLNRLGDRPAAIGLPLDDSMIAATTTSPSRNLPDEHDPRTERHPPI